MDGLLGSNLWSCSISCRHCQMNSSRDSYWSSEGDQWCGRLRMCFAEWRWRDRQQGFCDRATVWLSSRKFSFRSCHFKHFILLGRRSPSWGPPATIARKSARSGAESVGNFSRSGIVCVTTVPGSVSWVPSDRRDSLAFCSTGIFFLILYVIILVSS
jgi:hypothetical protein